MDENIFESFENLRASYLHDLNIKSQFWGLYLDKAIHKSFLECICLMGDVETKPMPFEKDDESRLILLIASIKALLERFEETEAIFNGFGSII